MHYIIDGYNLLFRAMRGKPPLQRQRDAVIKTLSTHLSLLNLNMSLVFDSQEERQGFPVRHHFQDLEIIYTDKSQSADQYILEMVSQSAKPRDITVVSSDRELTRQSKLLGAEILSIDAFLKMIDKKHSKRKPAKTKMVQESSSNFSRLLAIFEKKLREEDN